MKRIQLKFGIFALAAIVSAMFLSSFTTEGTGGVLTVRMLEIYSGNWDSKIIIVNEKGEVEEIMLEKFRSENMTPNTQTLNETINRIKKSGYELLETTGGAGDAVFISTYTFEKK